MKEKKFKKFKVNKTPIEDKSTVSDKATRQGNKFADFDVEELFKMILKKMNVLIIYFVQMSILKCIMI